MRLFILGFLLTIFLNSLSPAFAQASSGISVTPSILRVDLEKDPSEFELVYKNNSASEISLDMNSTDFSELEEGWKVKFLEPNEAKNYHYSLSSWLDFERRSLSLKPGEEGRLKVSVKKDALSPGGHYATILATISAIGEKGQQVDVKGILSTILFVRANTGQEAESLSITDLTFEQKFPIIYFPTLFNLRLNNTGNTELVPFGVLSIKDPSGKQVAKGVLNQGANYALPETVKKFEITPKLLSAPLLPGKYVAELTVNYGKSQQEAKTLLQFYYIDWRIMVGILVLVCIVFWLVRRVLWKRK